MRIVAGTLRGRPIAAPKHEGLRPTSDRVRESLTFSRDKNFEREAVVDERALIRDGLRRGMGDVTYSQVRGNLDARIASGEFQRVERTNIPGRQFTTANTIAAEHEIVSRVRDGRNQAKPVLARSQAISVADKHSHLNSTQKSVVEDVLSSPDRIQGIQGFAVELGAVLQCGAGIAHVVNVHAAAKPLSRLALLAGAHTKVGAEPTVDTVAAADAEFGQTARP